MGTSTISMAVCWRKAPRPKPAIKRPDVIGQKSRLFLDREVAIPPSISTSLAQKAKIDGLFAMGVGHLVEPASSPQSIAEIVQGRLAKGREASSGIRAREPDLAACKIESDLFTDR
jgi:hypothetical protein